MYNKAILWKRARENPVREVQLPRVDNARIRFLEPDEERRLLAACDQQLIDLVITGLHTGFRRNELFSLTASDIDFPRRLVWVRAAYAKNATARSVPMTKTLEDLLRPRVSASLRNNSARLFLNQRGQPYISCHRAFNRAAKHADIHDLHFHDLRHTFASRLVMSGADIRTVQELMGHKTISMTLRYAHLSAGHKQRAMDTMDVTFSKKSPAISHNTAHSEYLPQIPKAV